MRKVISILILFLSFISCDKPDEDNRKTPAGGWINGHEYVDMGFPSGLKWAACNVGATKPEESGGFFQWGGMLDVTDTDIFLSWSNCPFYFSGFTKYVPSDRSYMWSGIGSPDNKTTLEQYDDKAYVEWGSGWHIPTFDEWGELTACATWEWTQVSGVNGYLVTSVINGNSIFLPAAGLRRGDGLYSTGTSGWYWNSSLCPGKPDDAFMLNIRSDNYGLSNYSRNYGGSIRPVAE